MGLALTQHEADSLMAMEKHFFGAERFAFPSKGESLRIPLYSLDKREEFSLDISRGRIELTKHTFQSRARKVVILARIDVNGPPHRNPDGEEIPCPHLHLYREGCADKWAAPIPVNFAWNGSAYQLLKEFMEFCSIVTKPDLQLQQDLSI